MIVVYSLDYSRHSLALALLKWRATDLDRIAAARPAAALPMAERQ